MKEINRPYRLGAGGKQELISSNDEVSERRVNNSNADPVYIGRARVGADVADSLWQICYYTYAANDAITSKTWPITSSTASTDFEFAWDGETATNITAATQANPCVVTATSHGLVNGDRVIIESVAGMTELNYAGLEAKIYTVANKTDDTVELSGINSTGYGAYTSGGTIRKFSVANYTYA
jgi:hypothetical protein